MDLTKAARQLEEAPVTRRRFAECHHKKRLLGEGAFGAAWLVLPVGGRSPSMTSELLPPGEQQQHTAAPTLRLVAKEIAVALRKDVEAVRKEVSLLEACDHPNILKYIECLEEPGKMYVITEYCEASDLQRRIERYKSEGRRFAEEEVVRMLFQLLQGLAYIHGRECHIIHRDIKPANIFFHDPRTMRIVIGDFGLGRVLESHEQAMTRAGTPRNFSPQVMRGQPYSAKCDVWSLGMTAIEMMLLAHPLNGLSIGGCCDALERRTFAGEALLSPTSEAARYSLALRKMVHDQMLAYEESDRFSAADLLQNPIFQPCHDALARAAGDGNAVALRVMAVGVGPARGRSTSPAAARGRSTSPAARVAQ